MRAIPMRPAATALSLLFSLLLAACSFPSLPWGSRSSAQQSNPDADAVFNQGMESFKAGKYVLAIDRFRKLQEEYPFAPQITQAELKIGEAYYKNEQYPEAVAAFKEFQSLHPTNENAPFVVYHLGLAHFDQFSATDRDQKITEIAKGYFETVVRNYPTSPYAAGAREKLAKCLEYLAEHEFGVATFYFNERKYQAAVGRLEELLRRYRQTPTAPKALYQLGESYRLIKNNVKATLAYEALVQHYPNHPLAKTAQGQLSQLAKEKHDPLAALLRPEGRAPPAAAEEAGAQSAEANKARELNLVTKTEVVNEQPGDEKGFFRRVVDKVNPFSSSSPAPSTNGSDKKEESKTKAAPASADKQQPEGFFSSLWPFGKKPQPTKAAPAKDPQLVGAVDESLKQRGIDPQAKAPRPPAVNLPTEASPPPPTDPAVVVGDVDAKLEKKGKKMTEAPPPPEIAPAFKTANETKGAARSKTASAPPDTSGLIANIDAKLKRQGIDPTKLEKAAKEEKNAEAQGAPATPRAKREPKIELEPRLSAEKTPFLLGPQEFQSQEKPAATQDKEKSPTTQPSAEPAQTIPSAVVKGPPQPAKEKPAVEAKAATKRPSGDDEEEPKGIFDQLKEDIGKVGKILNPLGW